MLVHCHAGKSRSCSLVSVAASKALCHLCHSVRCLLCAPGALAWHMAEPCWVMPPWAWPAHAGTPLYDPGLPTWRCLPQVLAWLMTRRRWPLNRAMDFLRRMRPEAAPNAGYLAALLRLEEGLFGRQTVKVRAGGWVGGAGPSRLQLLPNLLLCAAQHCAPDGSLGLRADMRQGLGFPMVGPATRAPCLQPSPTCAHPGLPLPSARR